MKYNKNWDEITTERIVTGAVATVLVVFFVAFSWLLIPLWCVGWLVEKISGGEQ